MANELVEVKEQLPVEVSTMRYFAQQFYKSRLFKDATSEAAAFVKITAGREWGLSPHASMKSLYIVPGSGKVSPDSNLVASFIRKSKKYDYRLKKHTNDVCEISFYLKNADGSLGELLGTETFTKDDAKKAGTKNMDKYPKNMLFARCLMNGARFHCPDVMSADGGSLPYCIEELHDNISYDKDNNVVVVMDAEVITSEPNEFKELLRVKCSECGISSLSELASILSLDDESAFDSVTKEDYDRYGKLLELRGSGK